MLNLIIHGGVTVHFQICLIPETLPVVGLTHHHPMIDHYPVSRKVPKIGALAVHLENLKPHLSNAKAPLS